MAADASEAQPGAGREASRQAREESRELIYYLVGRFILVFALVLVLEAFVAWLVRISLPPLLYLTLGKGINLAQFQTNSIVSLFYRLGMLVTALFRGDYLRAAGLLRGSLALLLLIASLLLLFVPPLMGALLFSQLVARRVSQLQLQREAELAEVERQRSQFLTDVAHDLRTPLMAISGMAHAINDGVVRDDDLRDEYLHAIGDKADRLGELVSTVFDYAKTGAGSYRLERSDIDLSQLLLQEAAVLYTDIEEAGMSLSVDVSEEPCIVNADPTQLARVVANLLTNAVKHNEPGAEIALMLVRRTGIAFVAVADTGAPIVVPADELFRPFSRGDASRSEKGGSGLGLSICKRIAEMHGFDLRLEQPYGRFTKAFVLSCQTVR